MSEHPLRRPPSARRAGGDRGSGFLQFLALGVLAAVILGGLVALGLPGAVGSGVRSAVCRVVGGTPAHCAAVEAADGTGGDRTDPGRPGQGVPKKRGWCHGLWNCTWQGGWHFLQGFGGGAKDFGTGTAAMLYELDANPLGVGWNLTKYGWHYTGGQAVNAVRTCPTTNLADAKSCGRALGCLLIGPGCPIGASIADPKVMDDARNGRGAHGFGRMFFNGLTWVLPMKVPKGVRVAEGGEEAANAGHVPRSPVASGIDDTLNNARGARDAAHARRIPAEALYDLLMKFRRLSAPERTRFLDRLTPPEFAQLYQRALPDEQAELVKAASPSALRRFRPNPPGWVHGRNYGPLRVRPFNGVAKVSEIEQGYLGTCGCLSAMGALARQTPEAIQRMITRNPNGTYNVVFGDGRHVTITDDFPAEGVHGPVGWPAILEKAFAERHGGYAVLDQGVYPDMALEELTGRPTTSTQQPGYRATADAFRQGKPVVLTVNSKARIPGGAARRGITDKHAYVVVDVDKPKGTVTLANPNGPKKPLITLNRRDLKSTGVWISTTR